MKRILLFSALLAVFSAIGQTTHCVDVSAGGSQDGTAANPYHSIQQAIDAAANGDIIKVARGTYNEALSISQKKLQLLGGFAGAGDFNVQDAQNNITTIQGTAAAPCIDVFMDAAPLSGTLLISGFTITGGLKGIQLGGEYSGFLDNITIENNILENNGEQTSGSRGGAISLEGNNVIVRNNTIRNNQAGRGAAICRTSGSPANFLIENNLIQNNQGYDDHAGGVFMNGTGTITRNVFEGNSAANGFNYGWGGALMLYNYDTTLLITLSHNVYRNNEAPSRGGAVFVDEAGKVLMIHELLYNNTSAEPGSAIYVDADLDNNPSVLQLINCTLANNTSGMNGAAIFVQASITTIENSIFWNNGGDDFELSPDGQAAASLSVNYTLSQENYAGTGNIVADPLFANAVLGDYHVQSVAGRFDPATQNFVNDAANSPAIDAGNPASDFSLESTPNGGRINLGCYGNTPQASKSGSAMMDENVGSKSFIIYPNPAKNTLLFPVFRQMIRSSVLTGMENSKVYSLILREFVM